jgi:hypothetical protein
MEDRIRQLEDKIAEAKKNVRSTLSIGELSRESIRDVIKEVSETQAELNALFGKSDNELKGSTNLLKSEIKKLVDEGTKADSKRLKDISKRIQEIAKVSTEVDGAEGDFLSEYASIAMGGVGKARKHALREERSKSTQGYGTSIFTTIFGSKFGGYLATVPGSKGANSRKRSHAELRLRMAESDLGTVTGQSTDDTPAEKEEVRREQEVRVQEVKQKENVVIDLLEEIRDMVKHPSIIMAGGGGAAGADGGGGGGIGGGGLGDIVTVDNAILAAMLAGPVGGAARWIAKTRVGRWMLGGAATAIGAGLGSSAGGGGGLAALWAGAGSGAATTTRMGRLSAGARAIASSSRIAGGLISFGITETLWQVGQAMIRDAEHTTTKLNAAINSSGSYIDPKGVTRSLTSGTEMDMFGNIVPGSGSVIFDPNRTRTSTGNAWLDSQSNNIEIAKNKLDINETQIIETMRAALAARNNDEHVEANSLMGAAEGLIDERAYLVRGTMPRNQSDIVNAMHIHESNWGASQQILNSITNDMGSLETQDKAYLNSLKQRMWFLNPENDYSSHKSDRGGTRGTISRDLLKESGMKWVLPKYGRGYYELDPGIQHYHKLLEEHNTKQKIKPVADWNPRIDDFTGPIALDVNASNKFIASFAGGGTMPGTGLAITNAPSVSVQQNTNYNADPYDETSFMDRERIALLDNTQHNLKGWS